MSWDLSCTNITRWVEQSNVLYCVCTRVNSFKSRLTSLGCLQSCYSVGLICDIWIVTWLSKTIVKMLFLYMSYRIYLNQFAAVDLLAKDCLETNLWFIIAQINSICLTFSSIFNGVIWFVTPLFQQKFYSSCDVCPQSLWFGFYLLYMLLKILTCNIWYSKCMDIRRCVTMKEWVQWHKMI